MTCVFGTVGTHVHDVPTVPEIVHINRIIKICLDIIEEKVKIIKCS